MTKRDQKKCFVHCRVTQAELKLVRQMAQVAGHESVSNYLRTLLRLPVMRVSGGTEK